MYDFNLKSLSNRYDIKIIIIIVASISIFVFVHMKLLNCGAYSYARQYLLTDTSIIKKYGHINDVNLNLFGSISSEDDMYGNAKLSISISTENGSHNIVVRLEKIRGTWAVKSVSDNY